MRQKLPSGLFLKIFLFWIYKIAFETTSRFMQFWSYLWPKTDNNPMRRRLRWIGGSGKTFQPSILMMSVVGFIVGRLALSRSRKTFLLLTNASCFWSIADKTFLQERQVNFNPKVFFTVLLELYSTGSINTKN